MVDSRTRQAGGSHGLAGGFNAGPTGQVTLSDIPVHEEQHQDLVTQTLGGKIVPSTERDPIYMLGSFKNAQVHLTPVDAVVQMRPQLHHIDAEEEANQKKVSGATGGKSKPGVETAPTRLESKAIEIKMKDSTHEAKDRNLNSNAKLLRDIQMESWHNHDWVDQDEDSACTKFEQNMHLQYASGQNGKPDLSSIPRLKSSLNNGDWLDKMSAPREDGKKGLLSKLRGRERERARRKKAEEERRRAKIPGTAESKSGPFVDMSSDSDLSSLASSEDDEALADKVDNGTNQDVQMVDPADVEVKVKDEPGSLATAPLTVPAVPTSVTEPKRRGRPKKVQTQDSVTIDD